MVALPSPQLAELLDLDAIRTELATRHLRHFVRQAWHIVEPGTEYQHNWHIDCLCDHLESTLDGRIRNLVVTMPPRAMKSLVISVFFPAWAWIHRPEIRFLYASYAMRLSSGHSMATRAVVESDWYRSRWGDRYQLANDDNQKMMFSNTSRGYRMATAVQAAVTGFGGDIIVADDPHNVQDRESDAVRSSTLDWWHKAMATRHNNPRTGVRIVVQQRVHEDDVAGSCIASGNYVHLNLPMEYEQDHALQSPIGWQDPRTDEGALLWPERFDAKKVHELKVELGSADYAAQFQQHPQPAEGGMFKKHWWRYWKPRNTHYPPVRVKLPGGQTEYIEAVELPMDWDNSAQSWDMTFKDTSDGSYVVGLVGKRRRTSLFITDMIRDRMSFTETLHAVEELTYRNPDVAAKLIEEKANGAAVINAVENEISGVIAVQVAGSKEARAHAATPHVEAGNVYLPHPDLPGCAWVGDFIAELAAFPTGKHDDQVDAFAQLDRYLLAANGGTIREPSAAWSSYWANQ